MSTIVAIATPLGEGGIGVIRLSGEEAIQIASRVIRAKRQLDSLGGYQSLYARVFDAQGDIDEAVVAVFRAPHSYTGEDVVELSLHGGTYLLRRAMQACCACGAVPAAAGEFTKRAFLNGKIDLTQAESIMDLIGAQGKQSARAALSMRDGALFHKVQRVSQMLITQSASLSAWIDYPEEDIEETERETMRGTLETVKENLQGLLDTWDSLRVYRDGIETAIVGRPNVGKSTLMNLLADCERSIVTEIAGTTRDVVTDTVRIGDVLLRISDTAGIRETGDVIERAGVVKSEAALAKAQLVLAVFDGSMRLDENDERVIAQCREATAVALVNKQDLPQMLDRQALEKAFSYVVELSAKSGDGAKELERVIGEIFSLGNFDAGDAVIANERQRNAVKAALESVEEGLQALESGISLDAVGVCMDVALDALLSLTGQKAGEEVVNEIFARFCVGK